MDLAGDRVASRDSLAHLQLAGEVVRDLGPVPHLLVLGPHLLPPGLQLCPLLWAAWLIVASKQWGTSLWVACVPLISTFQQQAFGW